MRSIFDRSSNRYWQGEGDLQEGKRGQGEGWECGRGGGGVRVLSSVLDVFSKNHSKRKRI